MRVHVIETGRVQIKASQIVGRGHGLARRVAPLFDAEWSDWLAVNAYALEHRGGVGVAATNTTHVVLTPLHIDHDAGLGAFPSSEILVSPGELERAAGAAG